MTSINKATQYLFMTIVVRGCQEECWVMLVEPVETKHTGDVIADKTRTLEEQLAGNGHEGV